MVPVIPSVIFSGRLDQSVSHNIKFLLLGTQIPEDSEEVAAEEAQQKDEEVEEVHSEDETWEDKEGQC